MPLEQTHDDTESPPPPALNLMVLLGRLSSITSEQITTLRKKISPDCQDIFDKGSEKDKKILTLISCLSREEMEALKKMSSGRLPGLHEIGTHFHTLALLTNDAKYRL